MSTIFEQNTRPDLSNYTNDELFQILLLQNINYKIEERAIMVKYIFELWSNNVIVDYQQNSIECLICYENLTNGNNQTLLCGHKFHSTCANKALLVKCSELCINDYKNKNTDNITMYSNCVQCSTKIESYIFKKSDFNIIDDI